GYRQLATLVREGWFDLIVTTHADVQLENALQRVLEYHEWRVLTVGRDPTPDLLEQLAPTTPRVIKVIKLRGDAGRAFYALGPEHAQELQAVTSRVFAMPILMRSEEHT